MQKKTIQILFLLIFSFSFLNSQWVQTSGPNVQHIYSLILSNNILICGSSGGVHITTNNGAAWVIKNNGLLSNTIIYCTVLSGTKIIAGSDSGIYVSTNNCESWQRKNTGLPEGRPRIIKALLIYNSNIYAATENGVYYSTNIGETWEARNSGTEYIALYSFTVKNNNIYTGGDRKIYVSSDEGLSWTSVSTGLPTFHSTAAALISTGDNLLAGMCCGAGLYMSTNDGSRWEKIHDMTVNAFAEQGNTIIAGSIEGILISTNHGLTWTVKNEGLQFFTATALAFNTNKMFAGVELKVWSRPIGELIGVNKISTEIPSGYKLYQNYPNPFNPATKIKFDVKANGRRQTADVKLIISNSLGQQIAVLVNQKLQPGTYEVDWDASNYPSGIYFYTLQSGEYSQTNKMILVK